MRSAVLVGFVAAALFSSVAGAAQREPWLWTSAERRACRLDAKARQNRVALLKGDTKPDAPLEDIIDGSANPELLEPSELFRSLIRRGFVRDAEVRAAIRSDFTPALMSCGMVPTEFWRTLEDVTAEYRQREAAALGFNARIAHTPIAAERKQLEEASADAQDGQETRTEIALALLYGRFGRAAVDRFLYSAVAPGVRIVFFSQDAQAVKR